MNGGKNIRELIARKNVGTLLVLEWVLFSYVVIGLMISHFLPIPEIVNSFLSLPSWLIIPYFFGSCFRIALRRFRVFSFEVQGTGVFSLLFGMYLLIVAIFLLDLLGLSAILANLYLLVLVVALIYLVHKTYRRTTAEFSIPAGMFRKYVPIVVFCILVSMIPALMKVSVSPFPYGTIETISIPFEQYQPALRFMEFGYLQHYRVYDYVSLGFSSHLFNIDPLSFIWSASFLMMAIYSFGLYFLSYSISKSKSFALLTVFIGSFLNMHLFRDIPLLFKANVFLYVFLPYILYISYKNISRKEYRVKDVILTLVLFIAIAVFYVYLIESNIWSMFAPNNIAYPAEWRSHVWLPTIIVSTTPLLFATAYFSRVFFKKNNFLSDNVIPLLFLPFFCLVFLNSEAIAFIIFIFFFILLFFMVRNKKTHLLLYVFVAFVLVFVLFQHYVVAIDVVNPISSIILPKFAASIDSIPFSARFSWLFDVNLTTIMTALLILGTAVSLLSKRKEDLFIISAFSTALFLYLFPEEFAYRFYREVTILMGFVIAIGIWRIFNVIGKLRKKYVAPIFSALIILLLIPSLMTPIYQRYYQSPLGQPIVNEFEYSASQWVKDNVPENTLLISDYITMQLLSPLSNTMLTTSRSYRVQALNQEEIQTVWKIKDMLSQFISVIYNTTQNQFWRSYKYGIGTIEVQIEPAVENSRNNGTAIKVIEGNTSVVGVIHKFEKVQNWDNATSLYINWRGENSNIKWQVLIAAPNDANWFAFDFSDNFSGWKRIEIQLNAFKKVGSPNWENVSYIAVRSSNAHPGEWILGEIGLIYAEPFNLNKDDFQYLVANIDSTDKRYGEQTNIPWENSNILIVITQRTAQWVRQAGISEIWSPHQGAVDPSYLKFFTESSILELAYSYKDTIYVFKVK
ncbi:hypothetical protein AC478_02850 [miscellaneous Crenarchaeota group-1 archaeon SG8-32-3]|uniref:CBM11 domain-containing protein n=1 Tax=miscellaneous Crenarchaeota group-1 archaeon SG8-32-3 TaxID=1685125 RepID=A0A0M0BT97_9ARCH|nr:MAG: hypothetical protein AC478_02850 [miscellaneous Crenarchaeota group-1 archaeon SG8-32-3]